MPLSRTELKNLAALKTKKGRRDQGMFLAEGIRLLQESIRSRFYPQLICYAAADLSDAGESLLATFQRQKIRVEPIKSAELARLADTKSPQGIVGIFRLPSTSMGQLWQSKFRKILVCDSISDPGNLGTLIRSALAFSFDMVILTGQSADPFAPKVVRGSAGSVLNCPIAAMPLKDLLDWIEKEEILLLAATKSGSQNALDEQSSGKRIAIAIGSEASGLSSEILKAAHGQIRIPHSPLVESLNAAVAGSILMRELFENERKNAD